MKKILLVTVLFCLFVLQGYATQGSVHLHVDTLENQKKNAPGAFSKLIWEADMDHAFKRAKIEHKNVMVMVEEPSCKWCIKMKKGALSDKNVQDRLHSYVLLKVQRSDKHAIRQIEDFSGAIPSFHFMKSDKESIDTVIGYYETKDFLGYLSEVETDN